MATFNWKGVGLPFGDTLKSYFEPKNDTDILRSSILWIVLTGLGERWYLPEFGSPIADLLFEPADVSVAQSLRSDVEAAIRKWDDRIDLKNVDVQVNADQNEVIVTITYSLAEDPTAQGIQTLSFTATEDGVSFS